MPSNKYSMRYKISLIISVGIIIALAILSYNKIKSLERVLDYSETLIDSIKNYSLKIDGLEVEISEKSASILTLKEALQLEVISKEKYRKLHLTSLNTIAKLEGIISVLKDSLKALPDSIIIEVTDTNRTYRAIKLPYEWNYTDKHLNLTTGVRETAQPYFNLTMDFNAEVIVGNRKEPVGILITDNPYFKTQKMEVIIVQPIPKWYQSKWVYMGTGFVGGLLFNKFR